MYDAAVADGGRTKCSGCRAREPVSKGGSGGEFAAELLQRETDDVVEVAGNVVDQQGRRAAGSRRLRLCPEPGQAPGSALPRRRSKGLNTTSLRSASSGGSRRRGRPMRDRSRPDGNGRPERAEGARRRRGHAACRWLRPETGSRCRRRLSGRRDDGRRRHRLSTGR